MDVLIIAGYLGAGKTTFIRRLADHLKDLNFAVLENESGDTNYDAALLGQSVEPSRIWEMTENCVCCTGKADFLTNLVTISSALDPDVLIVEPTGAVRLDAVLRSVEGLSYGKLRLLTPVLIADAPRMGESARRISMRAGLGTGAAVRSDSCAGLGTDAAVRSDSCAGLGTGTAVRSDSCAGLGTDAAGRSDMRAGFGTDAAGRSDMRAGLGTGAAVRSDSCAGLGTDAAGRSDSCAGLGTDAAGRSDMRAGLGTDAAWRSDSRAGLLAESAGCAGTIVLSKSEQLSEDETSLYTSVLRGLNPDAEIVSGDYSTRDDSWWRSLISRPYRDPYGTAPEIDAENGAGGTLSLGAAGPSAVRASAQKKFDTVSLKDISLPTPAHLMTILDIAASGLFGEAERAKGCLPCGVSDGWIRFDLVGKDWALTGAPPQDHSEAVFIGNGLREKDIREYFTIFTSLARVRYRFGK